MNWCYLACVREILHHLTYWWLNPRYPAQYILLEDLFSLFQWIHIQKVLELSTILSTLKD